jgi:squalene-associated FAD-dependent desaturase
MTGRVLVIGAGLAGLSAATALAARGARVTVLEAAPQAGGRCRSYYDPTLDAVIDNGNHFVLTGNPAVFAFLDRIGAADHLQGTPTQQTFFVDIRSGERWMIAPNAGPLPFWILNRDRRVPHTRPSDYLVMMKLLLARPSRTVGEVLPCKGELWERLLRPFLLGALNTRPEDGSAGLAAALLRNTFMKGGDAYRIRIAHPTLAAAFIDPALKYLESKGGVVRLGARVRGLMFDGGKVLALDTPDGVLPVGGDDAVVLAAPPWVAGELAPGLTVPDDFRAIVNAHFKRPGPHGLPDGTTAPLMLGVIGGVAEWVFSFEDRISVTVSGADDIVDRDREDLARTLWADVCRAYGMDAPMPAWQIVKEKRATFAATPAQDARRPGAKTGWRNLFLAGDWTQTGLPGTIEGALRSGETAAALAARRLGL